MGGLGSGPTFRSMRPRVEVLKRLDVWCPADHRQWNAPALVEQTCTFGVRAFWRCPGCDARCRFVYRDDEGWACRKCVGGLYGSQFGQRWGPAFTRLLTYGMRELQWHAMFDPWPPSRPKGMHWRTYQARLKRLRELDQVAAAALGEHSAELNARIDRWMAYFEARDRERLDRRGGPAG